jgi:hypothetical protein
MKPAPAFLAIWHDVQPHAVAEYIQWHTFEHLPERLALPGFKRAARYELQEGSGQKFMCLVDVEKIDDFESPAYLARLNSPTEWTRRLMPQYGNVHRALCQLTFEIGTGVTPFACCVRFNLRPLQLETPIPESLRECLQTLHAEMQIAHAQIGVANAAVSAQRTEETRLRRTESTGGFDYVLVAMGIDSQKTNRAKLAIEASLSGVVSSMSASLYRLTYASWAPAAEDGCTPRQ